MSNNHSTLEVQPTPAEARPPQQQSTMEPPPYAAEDPRVSQTTHSCSSDAQRLKLSQIQTANLTADECIAHLKLLSAFADLRIAISASEGLFGLYESPFLDCDAPENEKRNAAAQVREKRWAVYVSRAASRFETWFLNSLVDGPGRAQGLTTLWDVEENPDYETFPKWTKRVRWTVDLLPPLDVLMVWHAYMLNPRVYLEDCLRLGKMSLWATGMPWEAINASIDDQTFDYTPGIFAQTHFEFKNSLSWDNLQDLPHKVICCPLCRTDLECLWVQPIPIGAPITEPFRDAMAYTDKKFEIKCPSCKLLINHEKLRAVKFLNDMERLINLNVPMPGTILSFQGVPKTPTRIKHSVLFPSKLIRCLRRDILDELNFRTNSMASMDDVRSLIEKALKSEDMITRANRSISGTVTLEERRAIRRMMSRYWDNSSPFSVELVGAVIRQGTFTEKMDQIGWIHSPSLSFTMDRLKRKYEIFFRIAVDNPSRVTVPTLDVDLAWHTHQLSPQRYFIYSTNVARGRLLNHEDKVEDNKLSDGFKWTAKAYQDFTRGQVYSECICWYCEAIRESNGSNGYFSDGREQAAALHKQPDIPSDPTASPHISAHNSVRIRSKDPFSRGELLERKLRLDYDKAQRRFEKRAKKSKDKRNENRSGNNVPGPYGATAMVYGYPFFVPFYYPYSPDPSITCEMYSSNPLCVSMTAGEPGSCVSGTCALMAAEVLADLCVSGEDGGDGGDGGGGE